MINSAAWNSYRVDLVHWMWDLGLVERPWMLLPPLCSVSPFTYKKISSTFGEYYYPYINTSVPVHTP